MKHILASTIHGFKVQTSQMLDFYAIIKDCSKQLGLNTKELKDDVNCEFPFQKDTDISAL